MICPFDKRPCCDDLCYGGGCLRMDGEAMLDRCDECGQTVSSEELTLTGLGDDCRRDDEYWDLDDTVDCDPY